MLHMLTTLILDMENEKCIVSLTPGDFSHTTHQVFGTENVKVFIVWFTFLRMMKRSNLFLF